MRRIALSVLLLAPCLLAGDKLEDYLERCERFGFAGSVLVARGGKILVQGGYGLADRAGGLRNAAPTLFEIASATKPFTAAAILKLEEQGKLSTDDPISKYLPGVPEAYRDITIFHLLTHTSGMPRAGPSGGGPDLEPAVRAFLGGPRANKPGEKFDYWNGGYALLAGVVETVTGGSYMDYCRKHLFAPAGMTKSGFTGDRHLDEEPMAVGYDGEHAVRRAVGHPYRTYGWQYRGMGGLVTSVGDLYRWDRALHGDKVLAEKTREKHFRPFRGKYACGWYVLDTSRKTRRISHGGDVRGFHTQFVRFPDDDACIVVLCNVERVPTWAIAGGLEGLLFGERPRYPMPPEVVALKDADLDAVAGTYRLKEGNRLLVRKNGGGIVVGAEGQSAIDLLQARISFQDRPDRFLEHTELAEKVVRKVARGDVDMMRELILDWIPKTWPDFVKDSLWPKHSEKWGKFRAARALGASLAGRDRVQVILALDHENGSARCRIVFQGKKLNIFDLNGPAFAAEAACQPASRDRFVRFAWVGPPPPALVFERDGDGKVKSLAIKLLRGETFRAERVAGDR